ncbi:MAG: hypothetical protein NDJ90_12765 [Oligoflexia bacterium]|nr:hypothetical protein [Oligoflexia bacterium]
MSGKYDAIDSIIQVWVKNHGLELITSDRDWPVRSVEVGSGTGGARSYQVWIDAPDSSGIIAVHIANRNSPFNRKDLKATADDLCDVLEQAWEMASGKGVPRATPEGED